MEDYVAGFLSEIQICKTVENVLFSDYKIKDLVQIICSGVHIIVLEMGFKWLLFYYNLIYYS